ncbi:MAG: deoxyribose-phosphate aldolase [Aphanocapsa lilacina HA4352-LM1]|jgi:deoxyribose-phosphate aldolase|nr:deoxyribose-phosphate aldolase [Aphanocapsa lilacina HA4352-LM1]
MISSHPEIELAGFIEQTCLKPTATVDDVRQMCWEAQRYRFAAVCVAPVYAPLAVELLHKQKPQVFTVVGFPLGLTTAPCKLFEAQEAAARGVTGLEVMVNLGAIKSGHYNAIYEELGQIVDAVGCEVRAILELNLLDATERQHVAEVCLDVGVTALKTSAGWSGPVRPEDILGLRRILRNQLGIKVAGGIHTLNQALERLAAGANRLGTGRGVEILREQHALGETA